MTSKNENLKKYMEMAQAYNSISKGKKISQLEILRAFLYAEKQKNA